MYPVAKERKAKVFMNGRSRAVRIPSDFELPGNEVVIRQEADGIITIRPETRKRTPGELVAYLRQAEPLGEEFPNVEDLPLRSVDLDLPE